MAYLQFPLSRHLCTYKSIQKLRYPQLFVYFYCFYFVTTHFTAFTARDIPGPFTTML